MQWAQGMMQGGEQRVPPVLPRGHFSKLMAKQQPSVKERKRRQEKRSKKDKQQGLEARRQRPRSSRDKLVDHLLILVRVWRLPSVGHRISGEP